MKLKNTYFLLRHGFSLRNKKNIASCWPEKTLLPLTKEGRQEVKKTAEKAIKEKIDLIFYSDILRTKQTAEIIGQRINIVPKPDKRLREINVGILNGRPVEEVGRFWDKDKKLSPLAYYRKRFHFAPEKGETYLDVEKRLIDLIKEAEKKYANKNILFVSHQRTLTLLEKVLYKYSLKKFVEIIVNKKEIETGELRKIR